MAAKKANISPQYLKTDKISVSILQIKSPSHFIVRECPGQNSSLHAMEFLEAENMMQEYYKSIEANFFQIPLKHTIVVIYIKKEKKFYRGKVLSIINSCDDHLFRVYLVDDGKECSVPKSYVYEIHPDFMKYPFQAVNFKLFDLIPLTYKFTEDLNLALSATEDWDTSALAFTEDTIRKSIHTFITVKGIQEDSLVGSLYVTTEIYNTVKCLNEDFISQKFAMPYLHCWNGVTKIKDFCSEEKNSINNISNLPEENKKLTPKQILTPPRSKQLLVENKKLTPKKTLTPPTSKQYSVENKKLTPEKILASPTSKELSYENKKLTPKKTLTSPTSKQVSPNFSNLYNIMKHIKPNSNSEDFISKSNLSSPSPTVVHYANNIVSKNSQSTSSISPKKKMDDQSINLSNIENDKIESVSYSEEKDNSKSVADSTAAVIMSTPLRQHTSKCNFHQLKSLFKSPQKSDKGDHQPVPFYSSLDSTKNDVQSEIDETVKSENVVCAEDFYKDSDLKSDARDPDDILQVALDSSKQNIDVEEGDSSPEKGVFTDWSKIIHVKDRSLWEKQKVPALCIGEAVPHPVLTLNQGLFPNPLQKILHQLNFCGPSCIQSVMWPALRRRRCVAAIAPPHSGKTVGYVLPIIASLISDVKVKSLPVTHGPIVIILCSTWKKIQATYDLLNLFMRNSKMKIHAYFADGKSTKQKITKLLSGCDIFLSTPRFLLEFFKEGVIVLDRCCHFVLDDGTVLLSQQITEIKEIMCHFAENILLHKALNLPLQFIICAERWTKSVASFIEKFFVNPLILFTSFLESAIYAQLPIIPHLCNDDQKKSKLLEILTSGKTIICATDMSTANDIQEFLRFENVRSFLVNEAMEHFISERVVQDWKSLQSCVVPLCLIVTDSILGDINISNADCLIHYDVPEISRLQFGNRFSCIAEHFLNMKQSAAACHILLSGSCCNQAPSLAKIIRRSGGKVTEEFEDLLKKQSSVLKNADRPLCHYFKAFGLCTQLKCDKRHHIDQTLDKPSCVTYEGNILAVVTHVVDATHFFARVLKHWPSEGKELTSLMAAYAKIGFQLNKFYSDKTNQQKVTCPLLGTQYILLDMQRIFYRVKVLEVFTSENQYKSITVYYIDEGWIKTLGNCELFEVSDNMQLPPPFAVEVYICSTIVPDASLEWNPQANNFIKELILDKVIHGRIMLCIGETLWLHPVILKNKVLSSDKDLNLATVDRALKSYEFAKSNKEHLNILFDACKNKVPLPKVIQPINIIAEEKVTVQATYAYLEFDEYESVYVSSVVSPHKFHVQRTKFIKCLDDLQDIIQKKIEKKVFTQCKGLRTGMLCIAPFNEDDRYYRAKIINSCFGENTVQVFYVDFGDIGHAPTSSIYVLPSELLLLPIQAIECELDGICDPHGGWSAKGLDALYNMTRDEAGDMKILTLRAYTKTLSSEDGNHYIVDLWDDKILISEALVSTGLACATDRKFESKPIPETISTETYVADDIPQGYIASSEDEDLDPEDKDIHAIFCLVLSKMMLEGSDVETALASSKTEISKAKRESEDIKVSIKKEKTVTEIPKSITTESLRKTKISPFQALKNIIRPSSRRMPKIKWWDTLDKVEILINLKDLKIYELEVTDDSFLFRTSQRKIDFFANITFYAAVSSKEFTENTTEHGLQLNLVKLKSERWLRLTKEKLKCPHIKYDFDHLECESDADDSEVIPVTKHDVEDNDDIVGIEEEDDSVEEEDESYVEPWHKLAQFRDPFDPMS